jgi:hypothetical protein
MTQTKRDNLVIQVAGLGVRLTTPLHKKCSVEKLLKLEIGRQFRKRLKSIKGCKARRRRRKVNFRLTELLCRIYQLYYCIRLNPVRLLTKLSIGLLRGTKRWGI